MKRFLLTALIILGVSLPFGSAFAATNIIPACNSNPAVASTSVCQDVQKQSSSSGNLIIGIIKDVIDVLSVLVGSAAVIIIIVSGIRFVLSGGDSNAVANAKSGLIAAVIGIVVVALAQTIVIFVLNNIK